MLVPSKPKKKSFVWKFFVNGDGSAKCKICQIDVKTSGNTTNLTNHLKRSHPQVMSQESTVPTAKRMRLESAESNAEQHESDDSDREIQTEEAECNEIVELMSLAPSPTSSRSSSRCSTIPPARSSSRPSSQSKYLQPRIDETFQELKSFEGGGSKAGEITNAILFMIAKDNLPFQTVENEDFLNLIKTVIPLYKVPGRKTMTRLIEEKYELLSMMVKSKLSVTEAITLTTDVWTDTLNTRSYLGMTAHFATEDKLESVTLGVMLLEDRHTSENLSEWLMQICSEWRITREQVIVVVTDSGANILKAVVDTFGKHKHHPCFAHTLNLVASKLIDGEPTVCAMCTKVKTLVTFFKHSVAAANDLRKHTDKKLIQSVPTRWNSTYFMLDRFIELSESISAVLLKYPKSPPMLSAGELQLARETVQVLQPVEAATREACGQAYITASKVIPLTNCLKKKIQSMDSDLITSAGIKLRELLLNNFDKRFGKVEFMTLLAVSTILDPRLKKIHFNTPLAQSQAIQKIIKDMNEISKETNEIQKENTAPEKVCSNENSLWSHHEILINRHQAINEEEVYSRNEIPTDLKHYLMQPTTALDDNPLQYWHSNNVYPILSKVAHRYFSIVATSVPSERLFSKAGNILIESRNRLSPKHLHQLLFLSSLSTKDWFISK